MRIINNFINDIFEKLANEGLLLACYNNKPTITFWEIQTIVSLVLPGELVKHVASKRTKVGEKVSDLVSAFSEKF
ncbi:hypothetical protein Fmac_014662 [Flemingia macrophylla]|uniref:Uncharacterized protein n=1 Tax=Flemingia macrophylla TaxID=520843 RepID=A0ABD1MCF2_9FABA